MNRIIVYPGGVPQDSDILWPQRYTEIMAGMIMRAAFGTSTVIDGLTVAQQASPNMTVQVGQGAILTQTVIDPTGVALGSLPADTTTNLVKIGINTAPTNMSALVAPPVSGQSQNWLVQAQFLEQDTNPTALPYYNAANPSVPFTGPANSGTAQNTLRANTVQLQWKGGVAATTGQQNTPTPDAGWVGVAIVTVANGQSSITNASITPYSSAPYVPTKLSAQRIRLLAPLNLYVSPYGSDTANSGLSAASPFLTMQKAWNVVVNNYDLNGQNVTVNLANGTYTSGVSASGALLGLGSGNGISFVGNTASPSSVQVTVANSNCFSAAVGAAITVSGMQLSATGTGSNGFALISSANGPLSVGAGIIFGTCSSGHIQSVNGGYVIVAANSYTIAGSAPTHWSSGYAFLNACNLTITLTGTPAFSTAFASATFLGSLACYGNTFVGSATGPRYLTTTNAVINVAGAGATYLPGNASGSFANGGVYV